LLSAAFDADAIRNYGHSSNRPTRSAASLIIYALNLTVWPFFVSEKVLWNAGLDLGMQLTQMLYVLVVERLKIRS
jgi:hypothetical protein